MAKKNNETVQDIMRKQLSILEHSDKLVKLEKETVRDKKIIQELKEREKISVRALVLFERKIKFLKDLIISELLKICKLTEESKSLIIEEMFDESDDLHKKISEINSKLYELCNKLEETASISESDKAFILNKTETQTIGDAQSRFDKLKADFNQKIGTSVLRKPGRPKKQEQSIVSDIGLGKKVEKVIDETSDTRTRLNEIFYGMPTQKAGNFSAIPQTADSVFDFSEALNPENSLQDIMSDIMSNNLNDNRVIYNKDNLDKQISRLDETNMQKLESGYISKPKIRHFDEIKKEKSQKNSHKNGILTGNHLFNDIKK